MPTQLNRRWQTDDGKQRLAKVIDPARLILAPGTPATRSIPKRTGAGRPKYPGKVGVAVPKYLHSFHVSRWSFWGTKHEDLQEEISDPH